MDTKIFEKILKDAASFLHRNSNKKRKEQECPNSKNFDSGLFRIGVEASGEEGGMERLKAHKVFFR